MRLKRCNAIALGHSGGYLHVITVNTHSNKTVSAEFFSFVHQDSESKKIVPYIKYVYFGLSLLCYSIILEKSSTPQQEES